MKGHAYRLVTILILLTQARAQTNHQTASSIRVHDLTLSHRTIDVLATLADRYHVVIGVFGPLLGTDSLRVDVSLKDGTLGDVFDAIVGADPRFEWRQTDAGCIHFIVRNSQFDLLGTTVHSLALENLQRTEVSDRLRNLPEVAVWLKSHDCKMRRLIYGPEPRDWARFALHDNDLPLSAVFDEVAARSGTYFWSVIQYSADPCEINIGF